MRRSVLFAVAFCVAGLASQGALGRTVQISGTHGEQEIRDKCGSAYQGSVESYGCTVPCNGGNCSVNCDRKTDTCTGSVPSRVTSGGKGKAGSVGGVLGGSLGSTPPPKDKKPVAGGMNPPKTGGTLGSGGGQSTAIQNKDVEHSDSRKH
jgi:hypothetical protein